MVKKTQGMRQPSGCLNRNWLRNNNGAIRDKHVQILLILLSFSETSTFSKLRISFRYNPRLSALLAPDLSASLICLLSFSDFFPALSFLLGYASCGSQNYRGQHQVQHIPAFGS